MPLRERSYLGRVEQYSGQKIAQVGETVGADLATVRAGPVGKSGEIPVDYRLYRLRERWLVYDVSVEGVSLVGSYRAQFETILRMSSPQALVGRPRARRE